MKHLSSDPSPGAQPPRGLWKAQGSSAAWPVIELRKHSHLPSDGTRAFDKKVEGKIHSLALCQDHTFLESLSFFLNFFFLFFICWFNLKPQGHTTQREKEMQKSLRAGTKRPLTMVLVNAFWSFTSSKLGPCRPEGGRAQEPWPGDARAGLLQPGYGLCTVDPDTSHCGLFHFLTNERYVAERHFGSPETFWENVRSRTFRGNSVVAECQKVFPLNFKNHHTNRKMELGKPDFKGHSLYKICT